MKNSKGNPTAWAYKYLTTSADGAILMIAQRLFPADIAETDEAVSDIIRGRNGTGVEDLPKEFFKTQGGGFVKAVTDIYNKIFDVLITDDEGACDKIGDLFKRALLDAALSGEAKNADNPAGWILTRLKKLLAVVQIEKPAQSADKWNPRR